MLTIQMAWIKHLICEYFRKNLVARKVLKTETPNENNQNVSILTYLSGLVFKVGMRDSMSRDITFC